MVVMVPTAGRRAGVDPPGRPSRYLIVLRSAADGAAGAGGWRQREPDHDAEDHGEEEDEGCPAEDKPGDREPFAALAGLADLLPGPDPEDDRGESAQPQASRPWRSTSSGSPGPVPRPRTAGPRPFRFPPEPGPSPCRDRGPDRRTAWLRRPTGRRCT